MCLAWEPETERVSALCVCVFVWGREREREREGKVFKEHEKGFFQFSDQFASNLRLGRFKHKQPKTRLTDSKTWKTGIFKSITVNQGAIFLKLKFPETSIQINCHVTLIKYTTDTERAHCKYNLHKSTIEGEKQMLSRGIEPATPRSAMRRTTGVIKTTSWTSYPSKQQRYTAWVTARQS